MMEFVTFETAKLAKEKGFNEPTMFLWATNLRAGDDYLRVDSFGAMQQLGLVTIEEDHNHADYSFPRISMPTLAELQAWLRETHNLLVEVTWFDGFYRWRIKIMELYTSQFKNIVGYSSSKPSKNYEDQLEQGLIEALKMLQ